MENKAQICRFTVMKPIFIKYDMHAYTTCSNTGNNTYRRSNIPVNTIYKYLNFRYWTHLNMDSTFDMS